MVSTIWMEKVVSDHKNRVVEFEIASSLQGSVITPPLCVGQGQFYV